jgi:hypothetical protein
MATAAPAALSVTTQEAPLRRNLAWVLVTVGHPLVFPYYARQQPERERARVTTKALVDHGTSAVDAVEREGASSTTRWLSRGSTREGARPVAGGADHPCTRAARPLAGRRPRRWRSRWRCACACGCRWGCPSGPCPLPRARHGVGARPICSWSRWARSLALLPLRRDPWGTRTGRRWPPWPSCCWRRAARRPHDGRASWRAWRRGRPPFEYQVIVVAIVLAAYALARYRRGGCDAAGALPPAAALAYHASCSASPGSLGARPECARRLPRPGVPGLTARAGTRSGRCCSRPELGCSCSRPTCRSGGRHVRRDRVEARTAPACYVLAPAPPALPSFVDVVLAGDGAGPRYITVLALFLTYGSRLLAARRPPAAAARFGRARDRIRGDELRRRCTCTTRRSSITPCSIWPCRCSAVASHRTARAS